MDFTKYTCPVCGETFQNGDDVVVCPECGAPHHRECYEKADHCFYLDKHAKEFSFESLHPSEGSGSTEQQGFEDFETIMCPVCFHKNPTGSKTCSRCGSDLSMEQQDPRPQPGQDRKGGQQQQFPGGIPFGFGTAGVPDFDPLAGLDSKEPLGDNVTAGEAAKFTGKNTPYFSLVFQRLNKHNNSKFSFVAFIFAGIYFLYRKMYGIGLAFALLLIASNVLSTFVMMTPEWSACIREITELAASGTAGSADLGALFGKMLFAYLPVILYAVRYILMIISGFTANRLYYKHTVKTINRIKEENAGATADELNKKLEESGGVNLPLALSFGITSLIIGYVCNFFLMTVV